MSSPVLDFEFQQERWTKRMLKILEGAMKLMENRDERAFGLLSGLYPPKDLVINRNFLMLKRDIAKNDNWRRMLEAAVASVDRLLDFFQKAPIFLESFLKEEATEEDEQEVIIE